jgi:hypothetical protein
MEYIEIAKFKLKEGFTDEQVVGKFHPCKPV